MQTRGFRIACSGPSTSCSGPSTSNESLWSSPELELHGNPGDPNCALSVGEQIDTRSTAGRLVLNVLASVSQWEREAIGERTAAAMQHKVSLGEYTGGDLPYGYCLAPDGEHLAESPDEQKVLGVARGLRECRALVAVRDERERLSEQDREGIRARAGGKDARMSRKRIDLGKVRAARKRLEGIAKEHPELLGESSPENVKGWESILAENEMGKTTLVAFRVENELLKRIDAFAKRLEEQTPGIKLARADAVRAILLRGLEELESGSGSGKRLR